MPDHCSIMQKQKLGCLELMKNIKHHYQVAMC